MMSLFYADSTNFIDDHFPSLLDLLTEISNIDDSDLERNTHGLYSATSDSNRYRRNTSVFRPETQLSKTSVKNVNITQNQNITESPEDMKKELETLRTYITCKVCLDNSVCILFQPCGHLVTCQQCAGLLHNCPVCRQAITKSIKAFLA